MEHNRGVSLTQIHPSPSSDLDAETDIDIIAIHGLDTKSPDTWIFKSETPGEDVNWLASPCMLPAKVGNNTRIFTCDWPADLLEQPGLIQKTADEFALLLLAGIESRPLPKASYTRQKNRPIVFIASCLGGIILMKALLAADHSTSEYTTIRQSTRWIAFLATPFRGTSFQDVANWAEPGLRAWASIRGQKISNLLDNVKGSTFHLEDLVREFTRLCQDKDYPIRVLTFYEKGMTSLHRKFPLSGVVPAGLLDLVFQPKPLVDRSSATLDIVTDPLPLDRGHVMMNKFKDPEESDYRLVAGKIEGILKDIRTNSLLDDADAWIRSKHYTPERLKISRLSGELLSMDQCYINLAVVEQRDQDAKNGDEPLSPFSLFGRQKVETTDETVQVELATIFDERKGRNGNTIQPRRILIRGRAGVGKTTLCKKIIHEFNQGSWGEWNNLFDRILWVPLRNLKLEERRGQPGYDFEQLFTHEYFSLPNKKLAFARELARALESEINICKTLFLLDGLDEVSQDLVGNDSMSGFLNELLRQPNIIITSRPSGKLPPELDIELETIGFFEKQVTSYIERIFTNPKTTKIDYETVNKIQSFLQNHWLIQGLVRIPIQLDALCFSWKDIIQSDMPETMTALYQAIELSLWKKDILRLGKTHDHSLITPDHIQGASRQKIEGFVKHEISFLESLAFTGLHNDVLEFEPKLLNRVSDPFPGFLLDKTVPCLSFLRASNPSSENRYRSYHFIHLTFQEYFAARYFVRQWVAQKPLNCVELSRNKVDENEPVKFFQKHKYTARYDILWRFVTGLFDILGEENLCYSQKTEDFFRIIEEEPLDLLGPAHQRLVMHCLAEVSSTLSIRVDLEQRLSKWLLFECQSNQFSTLAREMEFPESLLNVIFQNGPDDIKKAILRSQKTRTKVPASIIEEAAFLLEHRDADMRRLIAEVLDCRLALPDEIIKAMAAQLEEKKEVEAPIIRALGRQALSDEILEGLVARLKNNGEHRQRKVIIQVLGQQILPNRLLEDLIRQLNGVGVYARAATVQILGQQTLPSEITKDLVARLQDDDANVKEAAINILGKQPALPINVLEAVTTRLKDEDPNTQKAAIDALGRQPALPIDIVKELIAQLEDDDVSVQDAAIDILDKQPALHIDIFKNIAVKLKDGDGSIRWTTTNAIYKQPALPIEILKNIATQLQHTSNTIRWIAINTIGKQPALPANILKDITVCLKDKSESIRKAAIEAIGKRPTLPVDILKDIAECLKDEREPVRYTAINAIGKQPVLPFDILKDITAVRSSGVKESDRVKERNKVS